MVLNKTLSGLQFVKRKILQSVMFFITYPLIPVAFKIDVGKQQYHLVIYCSLNFF